MIVIITKPAIVYKNCVERNFLLYAFCLLFPILSIIYMKSVVYDDWRHVYFVYPSLVLLALWAFSKLLETNVAKILQILVVIQIIGVAAFMIRNHPFQQVYFNRFVSHAQESHRKNFDFDYWGASYKQGLDYIMQHDKAQKVRIFESLPPVANAYLSLPLSERKRVTLVDRQDTPYYFITGFRGRIERFEAYAPVVYEVKVQNSTILRVYRVD